MKCCKCGNTLFYAHRQYRFDVLVDSDDFWQGDVELYDAEKSYGPYTCTNPTCSAEYESLADLPREEDAEVLADMVVWPPEPKPTQKQLEQEENRSLEAVRDALLSSCDSVSEVNEEDLVIPRILWSAHCIRYDLDTDTLEYDIIMRNLYEDMSAACKKAKAKIFDYDTFDNYMCGLIV